MNKYKEVYEIICRLEDAINYIKPATANDLEHASEGDILEVRKKVEDLFFSMQDVVLLPVVRCRYQMGGKHDV